MPLEIEHRAVPHMKGLINCQNISGRQEQGSTFTQEKTHLKILFKFIQRLVHTYFLSVVYTTRVCMILQDFGRFCIILPNSDRFVKNLKHFQQRSLKKLPKTEANFTNFEVWCSKTELPKIEITNIEGYQYRGIPVYILHLFIYYQNIFRAH